MTEARQDGEASQPDSGVAGTRPLDAKGHYVPGTSGNPAAPNVVAAIGLLMAKRAAWEGTASDLLRALPAGACGGAQGPRAIAARLRRAAPGLREAGIEVTFDREGRARTRKIRIAAAPLIAERTKAADGADASREQRTQAADVLVYRFPKNVREEWRATLGEYKGLVLASIRAYVIAPSAAGGRRNVPTRHGITFQLKHLPELRRALKALEDIAATRGLLSGKRDGVVDGAETGP